MSSKQEQKFTDAIADLLRKGEVVIDTVDILNIVKVGVLALTNRRIIVVNFASTIFSMEHSEMNLKDIEHVTFTPPSGPLGRFSKYKNMLTISSRNGDLLIRTQRTEDGHRWPRLILDQRDKA